MIDRSIILKVAKNDRKSYEILFREYINRIALIIDLYLDNKDKSIDLAMDLIVNLPELIRDKYNRHDNFEAWLFTIAKNKALSYIRKIYDREVPLNEDIIVNRKNDNGFRIEELKDVLSKDNFKIIMLKFVVCLTHKEIAKELNVSVNYIKRRLPVIYDQVRVYYIDTYGPVKYC